MRSILIIGGNSDIGYATAKVFAKNLFDIHLVSRNVEHLNIKKDEIISLYKVNCKISHLDLLEEDQINMFFEKNTESPEVILIASGFLQQDEKNFEKIIKINYLSPLKFIEKSLEKYQTQKILNTINHTSDIPHLNQNPLYQKNPHLNQEMYYKHFYTENWMIDWIKERYEDDFKIFNYDMDLPR
jgi:short-subunit dehydrogenase